MKLGIWFTPKNIPEIAAFKVVQKLHLSAKPVYRLVGARWSSAEWKGILSESKMLKPKHQVETKKPFNKVPHHLLYNQSTWSTIRRNPTVSNSYQYCVLMWNNYGKNVKAEQETHQTGR